MRAIIRQGYAYFLQGSTGKVWIAATVNLPSEKPCVVCGAHAREGYNLYGTTGNGLTLVATGNSPEMDFYCSPYCCRQEEEA